MPTITENGGAVRYWRQKNGDGRAVLCRNGVVLIRRGHKAWHATTLLDSRDIDDDSRWLRDTRPAVRGATTRTTRLARRKE